MIIWIQHTMHKRIKINLRECLHNRGIKSSMDPLPSETTITGENYVKRQLKKNIRKKCLKDMDLRNIYSTKVNKSQ